MGMAPLHQKIKFPTASRKGIPACRQAGFTPIAKKKSDAIFTTFTLHT